MTPGASGTSTYTGELRTPGGHATRATVTLGDSTAIFAGDGMPPRTVAYRDLAVIAINAGVGLVATGAGPDAERWMLERFGAAMGPLVSALRERRLRQRLADALVVLPETTPVELVETGDGMAQLALDGWGVTLAPLDERRPPLRFRRADIAAVDLVPAVGGVHVTSSAGAFDLLRLGAAAARHRAALADLPAAAHRDAGALVADLVPDLAPGAAGRAAAALVDGRPASPVDLGEAWDLVERGVLNQPTFAASYVALRDRAGGPRALRWLALAPERPGAPDAYRAWFLVALPGNLVALELVSEGAHATYCFRAAPRATFEGGADPAGIDPGGIDPAAATRAVAMVSNALIDARFLREPIALPDDQLAAPDGIRYRLALRAIPSLAAARGAFVARLVHRDEVSWGAALDDLIAWHATCRDDAAAWPGRAAQEAEVAEASGSEPTAHADPVAGPRG